MSIHPGDRPRCFLDVGHHHDGEAAKRLGLLVHRHRNILDLTVRRKQRLDLLQLSSVGNVPNIDFVLRHSYTPRQVPKTPRIRD